MLGQHHTFANAPSLYGSFLYPLAKVPIHIKNTRNALDAAFLFKVNQHALKFIGNRAVRLRQTMLNLLNTILGAINSWDSHMNVRHVIEYVEMAKLSLRGMVINRTESLAYRARETDALIMLNV